MSRHGDSLAAMPSSLPAGVSIVSFEAHDDERGRFTEVFREEWGTGVAPVQWNVVRTRAGVMRGVHVHVEHVDYLMALEGRASIGLRDLRNGSDTEGLATIVELSPDEPRALVIPPGVAHGFLFHDPSIHLYAVSHYWDGSDEWACHWSDPALELDWPFEPTVVSERDAEAGPLSALLDEIAPHQPIGADGRSGAAG
jgi:dTDP-4-dehydrorhamnose 3,5-epimerase